MADEDAEVHASPPTSATAVFKTFARSLQHTIIESQLLAGDHIYVYSSFGYSHHGLWTGVDVVDWNRDGPNTYCITKRSLADFTGGRPLRRARYGDPYAFTKVPGTSYSEESLPVDTVLKNASALCKIPPVPYNPLTGNCECAATLCKIGRPVSLQGKDGVAVFIYKLLREVRHMRSALDEERQQQQGLAALRMNSFRRYQAHRWRSLEVYRLCLQRGMSEDTQLLRSSAPDVDERVEPSYRLLSGNYSHCLQLLHEFLSSEAKL